jgi:hypothetical protein
VLWNTKTHFLAGPDYWNPEAEVKQIAKRLK